MVTLRPVHSFLCLVALVIAGCATNSEQVAQTAPGGPPPRPKVVLVNDFLVAPYVTVVDRDFFTRVESKLGHPTNDVVKAIAIRRVNDEVVAAIIAILRFEAGLNARTGGNAEIASKDGTLVIAGELHAVEQGKRPERAPVAFGAGAVVADMTVSQVSGGTPTQLLTFTAQAPNGRYAGGGVTGAAAAARKAEIASILASKSGPDVNLSPALEAQAHGLGRAIADKIVAYVKQQGWVNKADLPEASAAAKPQTKKPEKLPAAVARQGDAPHPPNTLPCSEFTKNQRGNWYVRGPVTLSLGTAENKTLQNLEIPPKFFTIGGIDLYDAVQRTCGGK